MAGTTPDSAQDDAARPEKRTPHSIRFLDLEWERIEKFAEERGLTGPEFVRFAALEAVAEGRPTPDPVARLAPLIESTFRGTYIVATKLRDELLDAGREEELDELVASARALQDEILGEDPGEEDPGEEDR